MRRGRRRLSVGWGPPGLSPSGAGRPLGARLLSQPQNAAEGSTPPERRRGGTDALREPLPVGGAPMGAAGITARVSAQAGREPALGRLAIAEGRGPGPREVAKGCLVDRGDLPCGALPRAGQPGEWHGVPAGGCDAIPGFLGQQCGRHAPAGRTVLPPRAGKPAATEATAITSVWTSMPMQRGRACARGDRRGARGGGALRRRGCVVRDPALRRGATSRSDSEIMMSRHLTEAQEETPYKKSLLNDSCTPGICMP
jgi:hypothetical protein